MTEFTELLTLLIPRLMQGAVVTLQVTIGSLLIGLILGLLLGIGRVYGGKFLAGFAAAYTTVIRALPPLVTLFILFFVVVRSIDVPALLAGIISLGITSSGYQSEIVRGAIQSVGASQLLAARSVGMSRAIAVRFIILPQAFRLAIPPWSNEAAQRLKNSSLVFALGVPEMMRQAQYVSAITFKPFIVFGATAVVYLLFILIFNTFLNALERKFEIPT